VATATHGLVDCLIGFTGPYLLLSFLVGAAVAVAPGHARAPAGLSIPERGAA
jgi:hypothetical protein